jgi:hypothetical protein
MKDFTFTVGGASVTIKGDTREHAAQRIASHFSSLARLIGDGREDGHGKDPANLDYVAPPPSPAEEQKSSPVTSAISKV